MELQFTPRPVSSLTDDEQSVLKLASFVRHPLQLFALTIQNEVLARGGTFNVAKEETWLMVRRRWNSAGPESPEQQTHWRKYEHLLAVRKSRRAEERHDLQRELLCARAAKRLTAPLPICDVSAEQLSLLERQVPAVETLPVSLADIPDEEEQPSLEEPILFPEPSDLSLAGPSATDLAVENPFLRSGAVGQDAATDGADDGSLTVAVVASRSRQSSTAKLSQRDIVIAAQRPVSDLSIVRTLVARNPRIEPLPPSATSSRSLSLLALLSFDDGETPTMRIGSPTMDPRMALANAPLSLDVLNNHRYKRGEQIARLPRLPKSGLERRSLDFRMLAAKIASDRGEVPKHVNYRHVEVCGAICQSDSRRRALLASFRKTLAWVVQRRPATGGSFLRSSR